MVHSTEVAAPKIKRKRIALTPPAASSNISALDVAIQQQLQKANNKRDTVLIKKSDEVQFSSQFPEQLIPEEFKAHYILFIHLDFLRDIAQSENVEVPLSSDFIYDAKTPKFPSLKISLTGDTSIQKEGLDLASFFVIKKVIFTEQLDETHKKAGFKITFCLHQSHVIYQRWFTLAFQILEKQGVASQPFYWSPEFKILSNRKSATAKSAAAERRKSISSSTSTSAEAEQEEVVREYVDESSSEEEEEGEEEEEAMAEELLNKRKVKQVMIEDRDNIVTVQTLEEHRKEPYAIVPNMLYTLNQADIVALFDKGVKIPEGFTFILRNVFTKNTISVLKKEIKKRRKEDNVCVCKGDCTSNCENAVSQVECEEDCKQYDCGNQRIRRLQYPKMRCFRTGSKGLGVKLLEDVQKDSFIIEYVGEVIEHEDFERRVRRAAHARQHDMNHYTMAYGTNLYIDARRYSNLSRFINHSCDPNLKVQKWTSGGMDRIGMFALRNISKGEELTYDYKFESYDEHKQQCHCGSSNCKKVIG